MEQVKIQDMGQDLIKVNFTENGNELILIFNLKMESGWSIRVLAIEVFWGWESQF